MGSKPTETPAEPPVSFLKENWIWIVAPMVLILGAMAWQVYFSGPDAEPATLTGAQTADFVIPSGETWTMQIAVDGGEPQLITIQGTVIVKVPEPCRKAAHRVVDIELLGQIGECSVAIIVV